MAKILLVEDDNNLREIYGERLMAEGYDIVSASDGEEALQTAVTEKPDLIISDVMMPKISGFDMLDILRQTPETKDVKIIMMTALSQAEDKSRADKLGADKYLVKSQVTLEDVARVVHDLLGDEVGAEPTPPAAAAPQVAAMPAAPVVEPVVVAAPPVVAAPVAPPIPAPAVAPQPVAAVPPVPPPVVTPPEQPVATTPIAAVNPAPVASPVPEPANTPVTTVPSASEPIASPPPASVPVVDPVTPVAPPAPSAPVIPESTINPISGGSAIADTIDQAQVAQAQDSQAELNEVAQQIEQFVASTDPTAAHQEPVHEPTQQDIIHAQNAAEDPTIVSAQPAPPVAATIPPVIPFNASNPEPASSRKKIIQPVSGEGLSTPDIHALYEQEMAKEAAFSPVINPGSGSVVEAPTAEEGTANPISTAVEEGTLPPLETVDATQIQGVYGSDEEAEAAAILQQATAANQAIPSATTPPAPEQPAVAPPAEQNVNNPSDPNNIAL